MPFCVASDAPQNQQSSQYSSQYSSQQQCETQKCDSSLLEGLPESLLDLLVSSEIMHMDIIVLAWASVI